DLRGHPVREAATIPCLFNVELAPGNAGSAMPADELAVDVVTADLLATLGARPDARIDGGRLRVAFLGDGRRHRLLEFHRLAAAIGDQRLAPAFERFERLEIDTQIVGRIGLGKCNGLLAARALDRSTGPFIRGLKHPFATGTTDFHSKLTT